MVTEAVALGQARVLVEAVVAGHRYASLLTCHPCLYCYETCLAMTDVIDDHSLFPLSFFS